MKYEKHNDLPPRDDPNYQRLWKQKNWDKVLANRERAKQARLAIPEEERKRIAKEEYQKRLPSLQKKKEENPGWFAERNWKHRGIIDLTYELFNETLEKQNNKCAICDVVMTNPQADHCHSTGKFRAALCGPCNRGLGIYEKNKKQFDEYLRKY
jgi:hypothetical protein